MTTGWKGVFPAVTTQFNEDLSVDLPSTQRVQDALVNDGVNGLIVMGTCGENNSLDPEEKRTILKAAVEVVNGTAEPDGTRKHYFLQVPPTVRSAREAVAWTYGLTEQRYRPKLRT